MGSPQAFLIDGTAFCYRAFYAIRHLATVAGRPTNAVFGFARMVQALRDKERPDYLAVAFDVGKPTFRHKQFDAYKAHRKPMPDPLIAQIPVVKELLRAWRIPIFEQEGFEAEDVLGTLAKQLVGQGIEVFLVTGDKDALQLVNSHIKVYNPHQKEKDDVILDAESVRARYGVGPERVVDLMALMGDDTDNIPSVPGIGEKTASELLQRFGSLDSLYEHLEDVESPARRTSLTAFRDQVALSRELARIDTDVPLRVEPDALVPQEPDWKALRALFRELEFKQLLSDIDRHAPAVSPDVSVTVLFEPTDLEHALSTLRGKTVAVALFEAADETGAVWLALAAEPREAWIVRLDEPLLRTGAGTHFAAWLADRNVQKLSHDAKTMKRSLGRLGLLCEGIAGDTMLAAYLLNPARTAQVLSDLSDEYLDEPLASPVMADDLAAGAGSWTAFGSHACAVLLLHEQLAAKLQTAGLDTLYRTLELPLLTVLARMETTGIAVDVPYLQGLRASMDAQLEALIKEIYRLAGCEFNINSPKQLAQVLFERLKLPVVKRTKTGPSTDSDVLQRLAGQHALPRQLMQYREVSKLVSTYVEALPKLVHPRTGRLHTSFNQAATATGRLSSSNPNLQNIPVKTELGRLIRKAFIPGMPDGLLLAADYSQIELRVLAHLSGDPQLTEAFRQGRDIHRFTASLIYSMPEAEIQPEQRNAMKAVNFGIIYGMSAHGLSQALGIPLPGAEEFIAAYFARYPKVRSYLDSQIAKAKRDGFVETLFGRRRYIPEVNSPDGSLRQFGERMAINAPIQGTAADLIKRAMVELDARLAAECPESRMLIQVHDELVFEVPRKDLDRLAALVRRTMEAAAILDVPLTVTLKAGPNWLDMAPL